MKRIGLLGGMGWGSSIEYERLINEGVRERLGGTASADLLIRATLYRNPDLRAVIDEHRHHTTDPRTLTGPNRQRDLGADPTVIRSV